tara:strand:+ start:533 stop:955 length:423 start_codon:yes stop_codon:yes gene_type:complete
MATSFNPSGHIRSTTETNFKGRIRALVFGESNRIINPGDMILEMEQVKQGDQLGGSVDRFEIYIAGRDMAGLLDQVTRAHELFKLNAEWLLQPSSRELSPQEIEDRKPIVHDPVKRGVFDHIKAKELRLRDEGSPAPKFF